MEEDDNLFGDLGLSEVISGKRTSMREEHISEAWTTWIHVSNRPKIPVPDKFHQMYGELLDLKYPHERLMRCVRGAVFLPRRPRDPQDLKRLISALNDYDVEAQVLALLDSGDATPHLWEYDDVLYRSTPVQLEEYCGTEMPLWTLTEHEAAGLLISMLEPEALKFAAERTKLVAGSTAVMPSEIIKHAPAWKNPDKAVKVKGAAGRDSYGSGAHQSKVLEGLDLWLDVAAEKALLAGAPAELVRDFHLDAPDGYWDALAEMIENDINLKTDQAYRIAEGPWEWHPSTRKMPKW